MSGERIDRQLEREVADVRVAVVQHDIVWEDATATRAQLDDVLAGLGDADLVVLAEMFATGFTMRPEDLAEDDDGPTLAWLRSWADRLDATLVASIPWRHGAVAATGTTYTNRCLLVRADGRVDHYDKRHPFSYGQEADHYVGGDELVTVEVAGCRVTPMVCYDLRFADDFWTTGPGTDCFVIVANWPAARDLHWRRLLQARAIENQCWVVANNRVGSGGGLDYVGRSVVHDPMGHAVAEAEDQRRQVLWADVEPTAVAETRERFPFLADRR